MLKFTIKPIDVVFFGSGKPFNLGGLGESIFPPFPNSFASAIFARLYEEGIKNREVFEKVYGPFLEKDGEYYFPAPYDIVIEMEGKKSKEDCKETEDKKENKSVKVYKPKKKDDFKLIKIEDTDLGNKVQYMPWIEDQKDYEPFNGFISLEGLENWYNGKEINASDLLSEDRIFYIEDRISIRMDDSTGTVKGEDGLYRVRFIRLEKGFRFVFWVELNNQTLTEDEALKIFNQHPKVLKIGGEARTATCEVEKDDFKDLFKDFRSNNQDKSYKILFLTPGVFEEEKPILNHFENLEYACISGYTLLSIRSKHNYGNKVIRAIKPGSVFVIKDKNLSIPIDFYKPSNNFIGSNLILVKKGGI